MDAKIFKSLAFLLLVSYGSCGGKSLVLEAPSKIPKLVCRVVFDLQRKDSSAQSITIATFDSGLELVDDFLSCMPKGRVEVTMLDMKKAAATTGAYADLTVLIGEKFTQSQLTKFTSTPQSALTSKFLIISSKAKRKSTANNLIACKIFNFGVIYEEDDGEPHVLVVNHFLETVKSYTKIKRNEHIDLIFPDKLKNLNRRPYRAVVHTSLAHVDPTTEEVMTKLLYFIREVARVQNAEVALIKLTGGKDKDIYQAMRSLKTDKNFDLMLFEMPQNNERAPTLDVHEENAFCALVPWPRHTHLAKGFRMMLRGKRTPVISLTLSTIPLVVVVWWRFKNRGANDSRGRIALAIWATIFDQSVKLTRNRLVLTIMLQLIIVAMYFRSMVFNAVFSSVMTMPVIDTSYKTFNQLFESQESFLVESFVDARLVYNQGYQLARSNGRVDVAKVLLDSVSEKENRIVLARCNFVRDITAYNGWSPDAYYIVPERIHPHFVRIEASVRNPLVERLQQFMDWSFETGLTQIWEEFHQRGKFGVLSERPADEEEDDEILRWIEIRVAFYQLGIGLGLATIAFICELIYHNRHGGWFLKLYLICGGRGGWTRKWIARQKRNLCGVRRKLRVRRIQVQPIEVV